MSLNFCNGIKIDFKNFFCFVFMSLIEIRKVLTKIAKLKGCESLNDWIRPCENHLYWSATTTLDKDATAEENGNVVWAKFKSFLSHIINKHEKLDDPLFNKCGHGDSITHRKWFLPSKV